MKKHLLTFLLSMIAITAFGQRQFDYEGINYTVLIYPGGTVQTSDTPYNNGYDKEELILPETVETPDSTYKVTQIGYGSFMDNKVLKNVTISNSIDYINMRAFAKCPSLESVIISSSVETIDTEAFMDCESLKDVYCYSKVPPLMSFDVFAFTTGMTIHVPVGTLEIYQEAYGWDQVKSKIVADIELPGANGEEDPGEEGAVEKLFDENGHADVFDLKGNKLIKEASIESIKNLPKGIYIINGKKVSL